MQFSEKQLVNLFIQSGWFRTEAKRLFPKNPHPEKEYILPSERRIDILCGSKGLRKSWVVECKIHAEPGAIVQAFRYSQEILGEYDDNTARFKASFITIAAQFFKEETLFFADMLGIQCVHLAPVNYDTVVVTELLAPNPYKQMRNRWGSLYV